jgi:hypothetical protein
LSSVEYIKASNLAPKPERCRKDATRYCTLSNCEWELK